MSKELAELITNAYKGRIFKEHQEKLVKAPVIVERLTAKSPFARQLLSLQQSVLKYEDPIKQEAALSTIDLEKIYSGVDARSVNQEANGLGYTDFIVLEVLKWYKNDFFEWTNEPKTEHGKATLIGHDRPNFEEQKYDTGVVEVYRCEDGATIRYPRFNDPVKLLETRNGRCGEWNNCFCLILRSLGVRLRSVWNAEDHVWCEFYSDSLKRWVHLDSCEEAFDNPTLYNKGWGKKMSYVIAFDVNGAHDVSKRYVVEKEKSLPRNKIDGADLELLLNSLTILQRRDLSKDEIYKLTIEDNNEEKEFRDSEFRYKKDIDQLPRQTGSVEWTTARGEAGK